MFFRGCPTAFFGWLAKFSTGTLDNSQLLKNTPTKRRVLIIVENLSVPFDRRVWRECQALQQAGYQVSTISPMGTGAEASWHEMIEGVSIYRYPSYPADGSFVTYL